MVTSRAIANIFDHFDHNLLTPYAVGFDRVFDRLNNYVVHQNHMTPTGFPPYNIRKKGDYNFVIELALGWYCLRTTWKLKSLTETLLSVVSTRRMTKTGEFLHRGISFRKFTRSWTTS